MFKGLVNSSKTVLVNSRYYQVLLLKKRQPVNFSAIYQNNDLNVNQTIQPFISISNNRYSHELVFRKAPGPYSVYVRKWKVAIAKFFRKIQESYQQQDPFKRSYEHTG